MTVRISAAAVVATLVVSACSAGSSASGDKGPGTLAVGFSAEPANFDRTRTDGAAIPQALPYNVHEGLVKLDADGRIVPLLAESWTTDGRTYDFQLRPGVKFGNGAPSSASDVKFSIERVRTDWSISIVNHVEVADPSHARVVPTKPSNGWLFDMTTRVGAMFSPTGVADLANTPVGTGPYVVAQRRRGDSIVLRANPGYWGTKPRCVGGTAGSTRCEGFR